MKRRNGALAADFFNFGRDNFPFKIPFKKRFKIVIFLLWRRDPVLELQIVAVVCCHSIVFRNSASADRSGMAASRFIVAAAACVILLCFGAESRKSQ